MIRSLFNYARQPFCQANRSIHTSLRAYAELMVNGKMLHYEVVGKGDKVALCLPGALGTIQSDFGPQLTGLSHEQLKLVAWDPPGYGKSRPPPRQYKLDFLNRDCDLAASLMKNLGYCKYSLLGWSDGGITAMMIAAAYPENVEKMVIWGANAYIHEGDLKMYEAIRDIEKWSPRMRAPLEATYGKEYFKAAWEGWVDVFTAIYKEKGGDLCKSDLAKITCPTLIIHGAKDPMVGQDHADYIHENIANSRLIVMEEGKHNLHLRYANDFNAMVMDFLLEGE
ncbi:valacyclovir hydrolase-like [Macrobrachium nipponense]|uniref:valacyclovir hydrolase-like n=1 Tax=Macrobrachium nipponense TaxID=159736 RepID=UPI0030C83F75